MPAKGLYKRGKEVMPSISTKEKVKTAIFNIPFDMEQALKLSELINCRQCERCEKEVEKVFVAEEDIQRIAKHLGYSRKRVRKAMHIKGELMQMPCPFYKDGCTIQSVKPISCKLYPLFRHPNGRLACNLECQAGIDMHNLIQEKLCQH